jgi:alpha-ribazole phosphatase/probable phosphoglycerate mutase
MAVMGRLIFIRHGETELAGRFCGQSNPPLNNSGNHQAALVAEEVVSSCACRIYSSDLLRAQQTATCIGQRIGLPIEYHADLREIGFGEWEGLNWEQIEERWPLDAKLWMEEFPLRSAPHGEGYADFTTRIDRCIATLVIAANEPTIVVTHRGVMLYALVRFFGYSEQQARQLTEPFCAKISVEIDSQKQQQYLQLR